MSNSKFGTTEAETPAHERAVECERWLLGWQLQHGKAAVEIVQAALAENDVAFFHHGHHEFQKALFDAAREGTDFTPSAIALRLGNRSDCFSYLRNCAQGAPATVPASMAKDIKATVLAWADATSLRSRADAENLYQRERQNGDSSALANLLGTAARLDEFHQRVTNASAAFPRPMSAAELATGDFPRAEYLLYPFILRGHVNRIDGDGGTGKTTLALQIAVAIAAGRILFGCGSDQASVLLILAEDGHGETKARLLAICQYLGVDLKDLPIKIWCLPGFDVTLARIEDDGTIHPAPFLADLTRELASAPGSLVVLDSLADIASLDENLRLPVNALLKRLLGGLCTQFDATVLLLAHPSKASMADGSQYSGSTAQHASVRSRLSLEAPDELSNPRRVLKVKKGQYGASGELELTLLEGFFIPADSRSREDRAAAERNAVLSTALEMIDKGIRIVRSNGNAQKPRDVANEVKRKYGLTVPVKCVLQILNEAVNDGGLDYHDADPRSRTKAGFIRGQRR